VKKDSERIESMVSEKRVKLHIFEPSKRKIWTVVGKSKEHWLDPEAEYCSCNGYYFGRLNEKTICYHLESVYLANQENKIETIVFSDDEYDDFLSGLISDL
jgi:predicted nucleic acid-binding Zn finger protein